VQNAAELERALATLLSDDSRREQLGRNALQVVSENEGAIHRTVDMIVKHLDADEYYIAPRR
jgi:3-deoxy-D-manno-octulosonic-acid transferase